MSCSLFLRCPLACVILSAAPGKSDFRQNHWRGVEGSRGFVSGSFYQNANRCMPRAWILFSCWTVRHPAARCLTRATGLAAVSSSAGRDRAREELPTAAWQGPHPRDPSTPRPSLSSDVSSSQRFAQDDTALGDWCNSCRMFVTTIHDRGRSSPTQETLKPCITRKASRAFFKYFFYAVTYFPASMIRLAICWVKAITLYGSYLNNRRRMTSCVRSMSPSATAATTLRAAASILSID